MLCEILLFIFHGGCAVLFLCQICWNKVTSNWVTGSDDHTVAVWVSTSTCTFVCCMELSIDVD